MVRNSRWLDIHTADLAMRPGYNDVKITSILVCRCVDVLYEPAGFQELIGTSHQRIKRLFEVDVYIPDDNELWVEDCQNLKVGSKLVQEWLVEGSRSRAVDDGEDDRTWRRGERSTHRLERHWLDRDVDLPHRVMLPKKQCDTSTAVRGVISTRPYAGRRSRNVDRAITRWSCPQNGDVIRIGVSTLSDRQEIEVTVDDGVCNRREFVLQRVNIPDTDPQWWFIRFPSAIFVVYKSSRSDGMFMNRIMMVCSWIELRWYVNSC